MRAGRIRPLWPGDMYHPEPSQVCMHQTVQGRLMQGRGKLCAAALSAPWGAGNNERLHFDQRIGTTEGPLCCEQSHEMGLSAHASASLPCAAIPFPSLPPFVAP